MSLDLPALRAAVEARGVVARILVVAVAGSPTAAPGAGPPRRAVTRASYHARRPSGVPPPARSVSTRPRVCVSGRMIRRKREK